MEEHYKNGPGVEWVGWLKRGQGWCGRRRVIKKGKGEE